MLFFVSLLGAVLLFAGTAHAHERWILNPDQAMQLNQLPKPDIFTMYTLEGTFILLVFAAITAALLTMHYGPTPEWLKVISGRTRKHIPYVPTILRFCTAWTLLSSAFGMEPAVGTPPMSAASFLAPDLVISDLGPGWAWLTGAQIVLAIWLLLGVGARGAGLAVIAAMSIGVGLWGLAMLAYAPIWFGIGYYLFVKGGGRLALEIPMLSAFSERYPELLFRYPQWVLRLCVGANLLFLGVYFKVMQPNLIVGIIEQYEIPILSWAPHTFAFIMALVECCGGLLIIAGVVIRVVSAGLLGAIVFFALFLPETFTAHMMMYGVLISFLVGGPGRTSRGGRYQNVPA